MYDQVINSDTILYESQMKQGFSSNTFLFIHLYHFQFSLHYLLAYAYLHYIIVLTVIIQSPYVDLNTLFLITPL